MEVTAPNGRRGGANCRWETVGLVNNGTGVEGVEGGGEGREVAVAVARN